MEGSVTMPDSTFAVGADLNARAVGGLPVEVPPALRCHPVKKKERTRLLAID